MKRFWLALALLSWMTGPAWCESLRIGTDGHYPPFSFYNADGRLTGGFTTNGTPAPGGPLVILYADDLGGAERAVEAAGGRIAKPIFEFPGGRRFHFLDPDGYELAVWTRA